MDDIEQNYKEKLEVLNNYKNNDDLKECNILHIYPKEACYPNGYFDAKFFDLLVFNTLSMEKRLIEHRDGLRFYDMNIDMARVFIDGSTLLRFNNFGRLLIGQDVVITGT